MSWVQRERAKTCAGCHFLWVGATTLLLLLLLLFLLSKAGVWAIAVFLSFFVCVFIYCSFFFVELILLLLKFNQRSTIITFAVFLCNVDIHVMVAFFVFVQVLLVYLPLVLSFFSNLRRVFLYTYLFTFFLDCQFAGESFDHIHVQEMYSSLCNASFFVPVKSYRLSPRVLPLLCIFIVFITVSLWVGCLISLKQKSSGIQASTGSRGMHT